MAGPPRPGWTLALAGMGAFISAQEWTINACNLVFGCLMLTGAAFVAGVRPAEATAAALAAAGVVAAALAPGKVPAAIR